jgi:hypothetical protein
MLNHFRVLDRGDASAGGKPEVNHGRPLQRDSRYVAVAVFT